MQKVAIFGNAGGGKSTLSRRLAKRTGLPWLPLDSVKYRPGGGEVPDTEYKAEHDALLAGEEWIIDGFGSMDTLWERLAAADTLVYLDLPVWQHYWWVTKRCLKAAWSPPLSWPERSPIFKGTLTDYHTVRLCHEKLTPKYREYVEQAKKTKQVYHLQSRREIKQFLNAVTPVQVSGVSTMDVAD